MLANTVDVCVCACICSATACFPVGYIGQNNRVYVRKCFGVCVCVLVTCLWVRVGVFCMCVRV